MLPLEDRNQRPHPSWLNPGQEGTFDIIDVEGRVMEELLTRGELERSIRRALRRFGQDELSETLLQNPIFTDLLVQEIHAEPNLAPQLRAELYARLAGPGPGGIQALGWMVKSGLARAEVVLSFISRLPIGPPDEGALKEAETLEVADSLLPLEELRRPLRVAVALQLLSCSLLSPRGRAALLQKLLTASWMHPADRRAVLLWAVGMEVSEEVSGVFNQVPPPPGELIRAALGGLVQVGEDVPAVLKLGMERLSSWEDPVQAVHGLLDVLENNGSGLQANIRRQVLDTATRHEQAAVRRRAYSIGEKLEGEHYMREAVRDRDSSIRAWAVTRVKSRS